MSLQQQVFRRLKEQPLTAVELAAALHVSVAGVHTAIYRLRNRKVPVQHAPVVREREPRENGRPINRYWIPTEAA